ncbi:hypothetical protein [Novosphingobium mathurense]|uniref:hypothetical protein n=1 Tax=Novosphingobium mathurense TaxID=428990 RepID=UPI0005E78BE9|nr:hypothetical protein [Novosphingobium mathurense]CDO34331.1 exported hypothetical protein [Novosphingobium sp. KN65.2]
MKSDSSQSVLAGSGGLETGISNAAARLPKGAGWPLIGANGHKKHTQGNVEEYDKLESLAGTA